MAGSSSPSRTVTVCTSSRSSTVSNSSMSSGVDTGNSWYVWLPFVSAAR
ncbi:hypothetical protein FHU38_001156 [Saccharomonospora amisosensis]|uniref:Uncharacterized protein n=1 Tax=Saccharomonospora amisosensis TaxID=1128677 RepID=A0A7X5ZPK1_9PSEU|nr:hypothetical protein [Saccharomonospora amisosensis]